MNKPNALPQISVRGVSYYVDFRLEEVRPVNFPFITWSFDDLSEETKAQIRKIRAIESHLIHIKSLDN